jgi:hypothetical protein
MPVLWTHSSKIIRRVITGALLPSLLITQSRAQALVDYTSTPTLRRDITLTLLSKDVGALANELAAEHETTVVPLLRHLEIFSRAGHRDRVRQTLEQLADAPDWNANAYSLDVQSIVRGAIPANDLQAWRLFYERLFRHESSDTQAFVKLWEQQGDAAELDSWLAAHSSGMDDWFYLRIERLKKQGRAKELVDAFAADVRANPRDRTRIMRYLHANSLAGNVDDVTWLADTYPATTACEHYQLGRWLNSFSSELSINSFKKSLSLPFTEAEIPCVRQHLAVSIMPANINWEKQLRFWTKRHLAETYQSLHRSKEAQPLVEELVAMKGPDIFTDDVHQLAGAVQSQSGYRVVEGKVLQEEVTRREKIDYWLERANYYRGRDEYELEDQSYRKALEAFRYSNDPVAASRRLQIVRSFVFSLASRDDREAQQAKIAKLLRHEFNLGPPGTDYAFQIASLITDNEFELDELKRALFVDQPSLLAQLLEPHKEWNGSDEDLIVGALERQEVPQEKLDKVWVALERLVRELGSRRAYHLASAMSSCGAEDRAAPLFESYMRIAKPIGDSELNQIIRALVRFYCKKGDWQSAEKILLDYKGLYWASLPQQLSLVAVTAGQRGKSEEALRLWRLKANLDRRDLTGLEQLSQTPAKPSLRAFYLQMKKDDPLTEAPDLALRLLQ